MLDPEDYTLFGIKIAYLMAGFFGGLVRWLINPERSWAYLCVATTVGALTAGYLSPIAVPLVHSHLSKVVPPDPGVDGAVCFLVGVTGIALLDGVVKLVRKWQEKPCSPR